MIVKSTLAIALALCLSNVSAFSQNNSKHSSNKTEESSSFFNQGDNIISVNLINALDIGIGSGISYERILTKDHRLSLILPVSILFQPDDRYYDENTHYFNYFYFTPGIKFYPFKNLRRVNYAIGANLMFGTGGGNGYTYDRMGSYVFGKKSVFRFGALINNYVRFQVAPHFNLDVVGGLGIRYYDHVKIVTDDNQILVNNRRPITLTGQFAVSLGYQF